jgi:hypothetical protein
LNLQAGIVKKRDNEDFLFCSFAGSSYLFAAALAGTVSHGAHVAPAGNFVANRSSNPVTSRTVKSTFVGKARTRNFSHYGALHFCSECSATLRKERRSEKIAGFLEAENRSTFVAHTLHDLSILSHSGTLQSNRATGTLDSRNVGNNVL